jgi:murein DD-endopeptidase MepM/ murein hydrolase activator NlpD
MAMNMKIYMTFLLLAACGLNNHSLKDKAEDCYHPSDVLVREGDTLHGIAEQYQVRLADLLAMNKLKKDCSLAVGQKIDLPKYKYYKVRKNDNLNKVALMFDLDEGLIASVNNLKFPFILKERSWLKIPGNIISKKEQEALAKIDNTTYQAVPVPVVKERAIVEHSQYELPLIKTQYQHVWPIERPEIIERFAQNINGVKNEGIRLMASLNTPVKAIDGGMVIYVGYNDVFGNLLIIKHADDLMSAYAHLNKILVNKGDSVTRSEHIAQSGNSGDVSTAQLYLAIKVGEEAVDPLLYLPKL